MIPSSSRFSEEASDIWNFAKTPKSSPIFDATDRDTPRPFIKRDRSLSFRRNPKRSARHQHSQPSQDFQLDRHVTRDSVVEGLVLSLNQPPEIEDSASIRESIDSDLGLDYPGLLSQRKPHQSGPAESLYSCSSLNSRAHQSCTPYPASSGHTRRKTFDQASLGPDRQYLEAFKGPKLAKAKRLKRTYPPAENSSLIARQSHAMAAIAAQRESGNGPLERESRISRTHDHSRRRSRSNVDPSSILDRARPVPVEYHTFEEPSRKIRASLRKSLSYPSPYQFPAQSSSRPSSMSNSFPDGQTGNSLQKSQVGTAATLLSPDSATPVGHAISSKGAFTRQHSASPSVSGSNPSLTASLLQGQGSSQSYASGAPVRERPSNPVKERPGFFRRVFGSSKSNTSQSDLRQKPPQLPPLHVDNDQSSRQQLSSTIRQPSPMNHVEQPRGSSHTPKHIVKQPPQVLHKKASFFRRRRKNLAEQDVPTIDIPQQSIVENKGKLPQPNTRPAPKHSPSSSSLRRVMDPYLADMQSPQSPQEQYYDSLEEQPAKPKSQQDVYEFLRTSSPRMKVQPSKVRSKLSEGTVDLSSAEAEDQPESLSRNRNIAASTDDRDTILRDRTSVVGAPHSTQRRRNTRPQSSPDSPNIKIKGPWQKGNEEHSNNNTTQHMSLSGDPPSIATATARLDVPSENEPTTVSHEDDWMLSTPTRRDGSSSRAGSSRSNRLWLQGGDSEAAAQARSSNVLDSDAASKPPKSPPHRQVDRAASSPIELGPGDSVSPLSVSVQGDFFSKASADDQQRAKKIFEGDLDAMSNVRGAAILGEAGDSCHRLRATYMSFFDFSGLNILLALRDLCGRLALKGETQQVDRVLAAFSQRWCECNPNHGFKSKGEIEKLMRAEDVMKLTSTDVVHTICYSLLLLNTDLHVAELDQKMTRNQFIKNTLPTIRRMAEDESIDQDATIKTPANPKRESIPWSYARSPSPMVSDGRASGDAGGAESRLSNRPSLRPMSSLPPTASPTPYDAPSNDASEMLVNAPFEGQVKEWESAIETILKEFYLSIRQLRLPLHGASESRLHEQPSSSNLSLMSTIMRRTGSVMSKTPSETSRGRASELRAGHSRWSSKTRSRPKLHTGSILASSRTGSRTSLDESLWSPAASSTWSRSLGHTQTTMSTDSLGSRLTPADATFQQSIGFANALSHAIIREEGTSHENDSEGAESLMLDNEGLELAGAPWAKEGIVQHKHHLETTDKKAKDRNWNECFAVIDRGYMRLFSFSSKSSTRSHRQKIAPGKGTVVVGGGNWTENMEPIGNYMLRQTIANVLPPPGYSKTRPHVFALSLPTGAVHLLHVGTPEIAREFVSTANYWSARLSKEPLVGSVSNVEYGWGDSIISAALNNTNHSTIDLITSRTKSISPPPFPPTSYNPPRHSSIATENTRSVHSPTPSASFSLNASARPSFQGSLRSSLEGPRPTLRGPRLPADRVHLAEWTPPQQSLMASSVPEDQQLEALKRYVRSVEEELSKHNELRAGVLLAFSSRSVNAAKAVGNWERKSSYLLREIVKFRTYVDVLSFAREEKERVRNGVERIGYATAAVPGQGGEGKDKEAAVQSPVDEDLPEETLEALRWKKRARGESGSTSGK